MSAVTHLNNIGVEDVDHLLHFLLQVTRQAHVDCDALDIPVVFSVLLTRVTTRTPW
jgi:hypothetical protein